MYTHNVGRKFNEDGSVRFFPGNTIISMVDHDAEIFRHLMHIRYIFEQEEIRKKYILLPPTSYHMTVIEGVCDQVRDKEYWTSNLPINCKLTEVDKYFEKQYKQVKTMKPVQMRAVSIKINDEGLAMNIIPDSEADEKELKRFRDEVSQKLGVKFPNHDNYTFHISLAYSWKTLSNEEIEQRKILIDKVNEYIRSNSISFMMPPPNLVFFENMFKFVPERFERK